MASQAQIAANRRNALRSTGPRTLRGKAASSRNALKHGFAARPESLSPKEQDEIAQLARAYCGDLRPDGPRQTLLVRNLAVAAWRLAHLPRLEAALCAKCNLQNGFRPLNTLARYRYKLECAFYRAAAGIERLREEQSQIQLGEMTQ